MVIDDKAEAINALIEAVEAIERELGITPSGVYSDVRVRIDILEARINNPLAPAPNVENPFFIGDDGVSISTGDGYPTENRVPGSLYLRKDGYGNEGLYARRPDGYWHQVDTDPWTANGDLAGNIYTQTVIGFQNRPFRDYPPIDTPAGDGYVIGWNSTDGYWEPQAGFYAFGDLDGDKLNQTVVNLQGTPIVIGTLSGTTDGYTLVWNNTVPQWEPQRLAVVFDPLNSLTTTNLRSNRYTTQSPIDNTKLGIVNLGSDSNQTTTGVTSNYGAILGGDRNQVSGNHGVAVGGLQNSTSGELGFIGGGNANVASGTNSVIVGGTSNITNSNNSFIGGGLFNTLTTSLLSSILGGVANSITSTSYAAILSGQSNQILGTSLTFASILGGASNTISGASDGYLTILGGALNTVDGYYNIIGNGNNNDIATGSTHSSILNGRNNTVNGDYNTILNGLGNLILPGFSHSLVLGRSNSLSSNYSIISGLSNTVAATNNNFVNIYGDNNSINSGSRYSGVWGSFNTLNDGYISVFGDHNTLNTGAIYASIHGDNNTVSSKYVSIWGTDNIIGSLDGYASIVGNGNTIGDSSDNSFVRGTNNTLFTGSAHSSLHGQNNDTTTASTYSHVWGNNNTVGSSWATIFGQYGKADFNGQFVHSADAIDGTTAGSSQYSRVLLSGSQVSGGQFDLTIPTTAANLALEDGKSYDMSVRILVNNTSGPPTCARYVLDVLAHCEAGVLILDVINITIANDNGTLWTVSLPTPSDNELTVRVDSSGTENRRAVATVEWRELSRI
jgi:hypothetical protein